jgi:hypothetical protein
VAKLLEDDVAGNPTSMIGWRRSHRQCGDCWRRALVAQSELDLDYTEIRSPLDGRIGGRLVDVGNLIRGGTNGDSR